MEARRRYHERHAAAQRQDSIAPEPAAPPLLPLLDEAIARLRGSERAGILLSFFDNKTYREVGQSLGVSEEAARKRVARAVQKLREFFASRGVAVPSATAGSALATALQAHAASAPPALLVHSVTSAALASSGTAVAATSASYAIAKGASNMLLLAKLKVASAAVAACLVVASSGAAIVASAWAAQDKTATAQATHADVSAPATAKFDDGIVVEIMGIAQNPPDDRAWWNIDGSPAQRACDASSSFDNPPHSHIMCLRVAGAPEDAGIVWLLPANGWSSQPALKDGASIDGAQVMTFSSDQKAIDIRCRVAAGAWENVFENHGADNAACSSTEKGGFAISPASERGGKTWVSASYHVPDSQVRMVAIDKNGQEHSGNTDFSGGTKTFTMISVSFDIPIAELDRTVLQARPYDHTVEFKNVTLIRDVKTKPEINAKKD
jgi:hypothetical protein